MPEENNLEGRVVGEWMRKCCCRELIMVGGMPEENLAKRRGTKKIPLPRTITVHGSAWGKPG
jgi:hypothetical protein